MSNKSEHHKKYTENIKEMDGRVIKFLNIVHRAPREIQTATDDFLASIDKLKKNYVSYIVKSKRVEKKYDDAKKYLTACQREYDYFLSQDDYLSQIGPDDYHDLNHKLEKAKLELSFRNISLHMVERELDLSREKLFRLGRKREYSFKWTLKNHSDKRWAKIYFQDDAVPISKPEIRRKNLSPRPVPYAQVDFRKKKNRCCDSCGKSKKMDDGCIRKNSTANKLDINELHKNLPANKLDANELRVNRNSSTKVPVYTETVSKTRNVGNILPDVIVIDSNYEKTSVDEGIGDINWTPSPTPSVSRASCDSNSFTPTSTASVSRTSRDSSTYTSNSSEHRTEDELSCDINLLPPPPLVLLEGINDTESTDDITEYINRTSQLMFDRMWNLPDIPTDDTILDIDSLPPPPPEILDAAFGCERTLTEVNVDGKITSDEATDNVCSCSAAKDRPIEDFNVNMTSPDTAYNVNNQTSNIPVHDEDGTTSDEILLDDSRNNTNAFEKQACDNIVSGNTSDTSSQNEHGGRNSRNSGRRNMYEDMYLDNRKMERTKKKGKLKFLTKMFHGPWEGWEEG